MNILQISIDKAVNIDHIITLSRSKFGGTTLLNFGTLEEIEWKIPFEFAVQILQTKQKEQEEKPVMSAGRSWEPQP